VELCYFLTINDKSIGFIIGLVSCNPTILLVWHFECVD